VISQNEKQGKNQKTIFLHGLKFCYILDRDDEIQEIK
jgi:hypothetical protein